MQSPQDSYGFYSYGERIDGSIDPKLSYRFKVSFIGIAGRTGHTRQISGYVDNVRLPTFSQDEVQIDAYVSRYYVIGKHTLGDIEITFRNDIYGNVSSVLQYQIDAQYNAQRQTHASAAESVKFIIKVMYLDGSNHNNGNNIYEGFIFTGCWLKSIDWGVLDVKSSDPIQITATFRPDNFYHIIGGEESGFGNVISEEDVHIGQATANVIQLDDVGDLGNDRGA